MKQVKHVTAELWAGGESASGGDHSRAGAVPVAGQAVVGEILRAVVRKHIATTGK